MTLGNFGIPDPAMSFASLPGVVNTYGQAMGQVAVDALTPVAQYITNADGQLQAIYGTVARSVNGKRAAATKALAPVSDALASYLAGSAADAQSALATSAALDASRLSPASPTPLPVAPGATPLQPPLPLPGPLPVQPSPVPVNPPTAPPPSPNPPTTQPDCCALIAAASALCKQIGSVPHDAVNIGGIATAVHDLQSSYLRPIIDCVTALYPGDPSARILASNPLSVLTGIDNAFARLMIDTNDAGAWTQIASQVFNCNTNLATLFGFACKGQPVPPPPPPIVPGPVPPPPPPPIVPGPTPTPTPTPCPIPPPCPTPTPTPPPPAPVPPGGDCTGVAALVLPPDGTKEWCTNVRLLLQSVRDVGLAILDWADAKTVHAHERAEAIRTALDQTVGSVPFLSGFLTDVFRSTVDLAEATLAGLRWLMCALRNGTIRSTKCDVMTYSGLMAFKFAWEGLKQVRFGVSIFVSVTVQLPSEIPLIDNMIHYLINIACPNEIPSPAEAREAFLTGDLPEDMYKCWLGAHGVNSDTAEFVLRARREKLTTREVIEWARRRGHDDTTTAQELRAIGWIDSDEAMAVVALYDEIPTIADHLHWLQRNVFDTDYVRDFELMEGFEDRFWKKFGTDLRIKGMKKEYAELHYAAHWINPAPEQMKRMLWRLRPEKYDKDLAFNIDDYERVLREQDVGAFFRRRWKEIAYEVPAISYIKEWYRQGLINKDELAGYHRDLGYKPKDAELFADIDDLQKRRMRASQSRGWTMSAVASAWGMRLISANRVYELSAGLGYTRQEADAMMEVADVSIQRQLVSRTHQQALRSTMQSVLGSVDIGIMTVDQSTSALQSLGMPQSYAGAISLARAGAAQAKQTKEAINAIKRGRLSGEFDEGYARSSLAALGVAPQAIDRYLSLWALQWTAARKRRTARDLINDVAYGLMTRDEAMVRLSNLGYADPDRMLFLADAQRKVSDIEAKRLAATEKAGRAQELALAKAARDAGKAKKEIVKQLVKAAPVAKLQKWATLGIIGKDTFTARLRLYGYPDASITALYEEACKAKGAACEDVTKEAETKPIASAGTTVSPNGE